VTKIAEKMLLWRPRVEPQFLTTAYKDAEWLRPRFAPGKVILRYKLCQTWITEENVEIGREHWFLFHLRYKSLEIIHILPALLSDLRTWNTGVPHYPIQVQITYIWHWIF
jgi:hypothetical protein